jgi:hypothetical protein
VFDFLTKSADDATSETNKFIDRLDDRLKNFGKDIGEIDFGEVKGPVIGDPDFSKIDGAKIGADGIEIPVNPVAGKGDKYDYKRPDEITGRPGQRYDTGYLSKVLRGKVPLSELLYVSTSNFFENLQVAINDAIAKMQIIVSDETLKTIESGAKIGAGFIDSVSKGADGAKDVVVKALSATFSTIIDTFLPGVGQALGPFIDSFLGFAAEGPEATKKKIDAFVEAIPQVIDAIAEAIPVIMIALAENADKIVVALFRGTVKAIRLFVNALPETIMALFVSTGEAAFDILGDIFKESADKFITPVFAYLANGIKGLFQVVINVLTLAFGWLPKLISRVPRLLWDGLAMVGKTVLRGLVRQLSKISWDELQKFRTRVFSGVKSVMDNIFGEDSSIGKLVKKVEKINLNPDFLNLKKAFKNIGKQIAEGFKESVSIGGEGRRVEGAVGQFMDATGMQLTAGAPGSGAVPDLTSARAQQTTAIVGVLNLILNELRQPTMLDADIAWRTDVLGKMMLEVSKNNRRTA